MSGRHSFGELTREYTRERRQRIAEMKSELLARCRCMSFAAHGR